MATTATHTLLLSAIHCNTSTQAASGAEGYGYGYLGTGAHLASTGSHPRFYMDKYIWI